MVPTGLRIIFIMEWYVPEGKQMFIKHWYGTIPVLITFHSTDLKLALSYCLILVLGHLREFIYLQANSSPIQHQVRLTCCTADLSSQFLDHCLLQNHVLVLTPRPNNQAFVLFLEPWSQYPTNLPLTILPDLDSISGYICVLCGCIFFTSYQTTSIGIAHLQTRLDCYSQSSLTSTWSVNTSSNWP